MLVLPLNSKQLMDLTTFAQEINGFSSPLFFLLLPIIFLILKQIKSASLKKKKIHNLPPGPSPWPILGNIPHMAMTKKPHISITHFAKVHGPLISLRLGSQLLVVGSSPEVAAGILKTHDRLLSARYVPKVTPLKASDLNHVSLIWAVECSDHRKSLRVLCRAELFSAKVVESQATLRETKVAEMVDLLRSKEGKILKISEIVFATVFNTLGNLCFSKDFIGLEDEGMASDLKRTIWKMMELATTPNIADFYPILEGLDLQGLKKKALKCMEEVFGIWEVIIKERREMDGHDCSRKRDFLDVMLAMGFSDLQINAVTLELFIAGTDTVTSTIEWALAELLKNKEALNRVCEELSHEDSIKESNVSQLPYLQACIKETLRLHPPVPFLLPRRALETCEIMNYTIPKESKVFVNVWAIGRDPTIWEDPLIFKPERFLDSSLDFKGQDFEFLPFGAGRKMCPGQAMAAKQLSLILANLIRFFDWSLPNDGDLSKLDMSEKFGVTLQKEKPLLLIPKGK